MPCKDFMISNNNHMDSFKVVTQVAHTWWGGSLQEQQKDNHHKQWYQTTLTRPVLHKQQDYKSRFTYSLYPIFIRTTTATRKRFFFFFERHRTRISFSTCWIAKIRSSTPTSQETLNNNTEGEGGGEGRGNIPRRCSSPRACGLRNPPPATKPDKSNQSSTDGKRESKRKHEV